VTECITCLKLKLLNLGDRIMRTASATKAPRKGMSTTAATRRKRRELKARASRTYYASDKAGTTLFRFLNHASRLGAIQGEGLVPLGALQYRNLIAEDIDNKLKLVDRRRDVQPAKPAPSSQPVNIDPNLLAVAIAAALKQVGMTGVNLGEQPSGARQSPSH
jgi:hypothetical protein